MEYPKGEATTAGALSLTLSGVAMEQVCLRCLFLLFIIAICSGEFSDRSLSSVKGSSHFLN